MIASRFVLVGAPSGTVQHGSATGQRIRVFSMATGLQEWASPGQAGIGQFKFIVPMPDGGFLCGGTEDTGHGSAHNLERYSATGTLTWAIRCGAGANLEGACYVDDAEKIVAVGAADSGGNNLFIVDAAAGTFTSHRVLDGTLLYGAASHISAPSEIYLGHESYDDPVIADAYTLSRWTLGLVRSQGINRDARVRSVQWITADRLLTRGNTNANRMINPATGSEIGVAFTMDSRTQGALLATARGAGMMVIAAGRTGTGSLNRRWLYDCGNYDTVTTVVNTNVDEGSSYLNRNAAAICENGLAYVGVNNFAGSGKLQINPNFAGTWTNVLSSGSFPSIAHGADCYDCAFLPEGVTPGGGITLDDGIALYPALALPKALSGAIAHAQSVALDIHVAKPAQEYRIDDTPYFYYGNQSSGGSPSISRYTLTDAAPIWTNPAVGVRSPGAILPLRDGGVVVTGGAFGSDPAGERVVMIRYAPDGQVIWRRVDPLMAGDTINGAALNETDGTLWFGGRSGSNNLGKASLQTGELLSRTRIHDDVDLQYTATVYPVLGSGCLAVLQQDAEVGGTMARIVEVAPDGSITRAFGAGLPSIIRAVAVSDSGIVAIGHTSTGTPLRQAAFYRNGVEIGTLGVATIDSAGYYAEGIDFARIDGVLRMAVVVRTGANEYRIQLYQVQEFPFSLSPLVSQTYAFRNMAGVALHPTKAPLGIWWSVADGSSSAFVAGASLNPAINYTNSNEGRCGAVVWARPPEQQGIPLGVPMSLPTLILELSHRFDSIPLYSSIATPDGFGGTWFTQISTRPDGVKLAPVVARPLTENRYVGALALPQIYRAGVFGASELILQIRSIRGRRTRAGIEVTVVGDYIEGAEDVLPDGAPLVVRAGLTLPDGREMVDTMFSVSLTGVAVRRTVSDSSVTLTGFSADDRAGAFQARLLHGVQYVSDSTTARRVRCAINPYVAPGDRAVLATGERFDIAEVVYTITPDAAFMEVSA